MTAAGVATDASTITVTGVRGASGRRQLAEKMVGVPGRYRRQLDESEAAVVEYELEVRGPLDCSKTRLPASVVAVVPIAACCELLFCLQVSLATVAQATQVVATTVEEVAAGDVTIGSYAVTGAERIETVALPSNSKTR